MRKKKTRKTVLDKVIPYQSIGLLDCHKGIHQHLVPRAIDEG